MLNNHSLRAKKYIEELKERELEDREEKTKSEFIISKDDMDKFEEQEKKKRRPIIRNFIDKAIKTNVMWNRPKIIRDKLKDKNN